MSHLEDENLVMNYRQRTTDPFIIEEISNDGIRLQRRIKTLEESIKNYSQYINVLKDELYLLIEAKFEKEKEARATIGPKNQS